ncbi:hypothetical protein AAEH84_05785 [Shewanella indica]
MNPLIKAFVENGRLASLLIALLLVAGQRVAPSAASAARGGQ